MKASACSARRLDLIIVMLCAPWIDTEGNNAFNTWTVLVAELQVPKKLQSVAEKVYVAPFCNNCWGMGTGGLKV